MTNLIFILPDRTRVEKYGETVPRIGDHIELQPCPGWPDDPVGVFRVAGVTHHYRRSSYSTATLSLSTP